MGPELPQAWRHGVLVELDEDTAPGAGCYTTGLWTGREIRWSTPVIERLARDSEAFGYGRIDSLEGALSMHALGACAFGSSEGIIRFEARPGSNGEPQILGTARPSGNPPETARVGFVSAVHPGPHPQAPGAKVPRPEIDAARIERDARNLDEVLLFDAEGFLVEGSRCNVLLTLADGRWATPDRKFGGVFGVGLELCLARVPKLHECALRREDLQSAQEILVTNAARGAVPVAELDGHALPSVGSGALATRLDEALAD